MGDVRDFSLRENWAIHRSLFSDHGSQITAQVDVMNRKMRGWRIDRILHLAGNATHASHCSKTAICSKTGICPLTFSLCATVCYRAYDAVATLSP